MLDAKIPQPSLEHLKRLTDDTGVVQHAKFTIPDREPGYCTDDNARAVIVTAKYYAKYREPQALELLNTYLAFVLYAQNEDGSIKNFMSFDRTWLKDEPASDALGRVLWAFGTLIANPPSASYLSLARDRFDFCVGQVASQSPRGLAYSILGMADYLKQFPQADDIKQQLAMASDRLADQYEQIAQPDWRWFENRLTYDNAVLPHALFAAGLTLQDGKYLEVAERTCEFLLQNTFSGEHFSFVGNNGWYERGGTRAAFDQQPIEAASTVLILRAAYDATGDSQFLALQRKAFDWFLGQNDLHLPLYDFATKGCCDALMADGVNMNQGAESTLSFLLALLAMVEPYSVSDKLERAKIILLPQVKIVEKQTTPSITARDSAVRRPVESDEI